MESLAGVAMATVGLVVIGGYLMGSIPFGVIATRLGGAGDVRDVGSGNIGATNVLRTGRKDLAAITLLGDALKGVAAVLLAGLLTHWSAAIMAIAGGAAFVGHLFPIWLKFQGGKGVATFYGVLFAMCWPVGLLSGLTWLAMAALFRMSSLASLAAAVLAPLFVFATDGLGIPGHEKYPVILLTLVMAVLIFIRHHENIRRLLKGEEPKIGAKLDTPPPP